MSRDYMYSGEFYDIRSQDSSSFYGWMGDSPHTGSESRETPRTKAGRRHPALAAALAGVFAWALIPIAAGLAALDEDVLKPHHLASEVRLLPSAATLCILVGIVSFAYFRSKRALIPVAIALPVFAVVAWSFWTGLILIPILLFFGWSVLWLLGKMGISFGIGFYI